MATVDDVVDHFQSFVDTSLLQYDELCIAIFGKTREAALASVLAEQVTLTVCVSWESFVSDLIIEHIATSPYVFLSNLSDRISQSIKERYGAPTGNRVHFDRPQTVTRNTIKKLIDPKGFHLSVSSGEGLAKIANKHLPARQARKFSLPSESIELIDFVKATRNFLSHRSQSSRTELRSIISGISPKGKNGPLAGDFRQVGPYLKYGQPGQDKRSTFIGKRLREIAQDLR